MIMRYHTYHNIDPKKGSMKTVGALVAVIVAGVFGLSGYAHAQNSLTLSVTPPLFQLSLDRGDFWASSIKIVNANPYELTVYASLVNFAAQGEGGQGTFTPLLEEEGLDNYSLGNWVTVENGPIVIESGKSAEIPFSIRVPENAPPGGHYAAILVGTQPAASPEGGSYISVSSLVSSLLFVRIKGDVVEDASIRDFFAEKTFYQEADVSFALRFENKGNVHLHPQGDIKIYNMWGKERGVIPVNQKTNFGNVLPESIRKFEFRWSGEPNTFEIGRYSAVASLTYGEDSRKNISQVTHFWIIPVKPVAAVLGTLLLFAAFLVFAIRRYIRRAIALEGVPGREPILQEGVAGGLPGAQPSHGTAQNMNLKTLAQPIVEGVMDLRSVRMSAGVSRSAERA